MNNLDICGVKTTDKYEGVETLLHYLLDFPKHIIPNGYFRPGPLCLASSQGQKVKRSQVKRVKGKRGHMSKRLQVKSSKVKKDTGQKGESYKCHISKRS
jgi:hypothetical protein